jgi:DNA-directed RNA polymerase II subunit RPB3
MTVILQLKIEETLIALKKYKMDPDIQILEVKKDWIRFALKNCHVSLANAIRRVMIAEVPTLAIDKVIFYYNHSTQCEEFLAQRLGLIPLYSIDPSKKIHDEFIESKNCDCEQECPRCCVRLECNVKDNKIMSSEDIVPEKGWGIQYIRPVKYKINGKWTGIDIVKLNEGLHFRASAKLGIGKDHAKWSPVSIATYVIDPQTNDFIFNVETTGCLSPIEILDKSLKILIEKMKKHF